MNVIHDTQRIAEFDEMVARYDAGLPLLALMVTGTSAPSTLYRMTADACARGWQAILLGAGQAREMLAASAGAPGPADRLSEWGPEALIALARYHGEHGDGLALLIEDVEDCDDELLAMLLTTHAQAAGESAPLIIAGCSSMSPAETSARLTRLAPDAARLVAYHRG